MKKPRSPRYSERLDCEGDEAEASSPPSPPPPPVREKGFEYDVFLSFRGPDTRNGFTGHLHAALKVRGIHAFIDSEDLEKGQKVEALFKYIEKSKVSVPIFSKGYAESKWCLKEIAKIVECKSLILPVFFDVEPKDVRHQTGPFADAFRSHLEKDNINNEEVSKWSAALAEAGKVSGYDLASTGGNEAELVGLIVTRILSEVNKTSLYVAKHPVGLDSRIADVEEMLHVDDNNVRMVGIHGMGGIGKTTLAKAVYNQIYTRFDASSFIANVRETAKQSTDLVSLQEKLLRQFFNDENAKVSSIDQGIEIIKKRIRSTKVLLVLDDVDDQSQLDALAGSLNWFCSGSRIIITTRDKHALGAKSVKLYEPKELDGAQSLELFSWHAFGKEKPDAKFAKLSKEVASIASGLPLALQVFGRLFVGFETDEKWRTMLARLKAAQRKDIYEKLKISYDVLEEEEKKVFLDIACFFVGKGREHAVLMWEACDLFPDSTIDVLMRKCLVSINDDSGKFEMHDQIRDMGRKIVKDESRSNPGLMSRLWKEDEAVDVLQNKTGTEQIEAIELLGTYGKPMYVEAESFVAMSKLRMLWLGGRVKLKGEFEHFPKKLRWLKWCIKEHLDSLPDGLHLENIVVLDLSSSQITQLWNPQGLESTQVFKKMKVLKLTDCDNLTICPDFTSMPHLQKLNFDGCNTMSEVDPSIGLLKSLTHLSLKGCWSLKTLPHEIWQLTSLEVLYLSCAKITTLPSQMKDPKSLGKLKVLDFTSCSNLTICPDFARMPHLEKLNFAGCQKMSEFHSSIGLLKRLTHLNLLFCTSLKELPSEIWQLTSLEELDLSSCFKITTLPSQLGNSKSLASLTLCNCTSLMELPDVSRIKGLQYLYLSGCERLVNVPGIQDLDKLEILELRDCGNLIRCPLFSSNMTHLQRLDFGDCAKMTELDPSIGHLKNLTDLILRNCKSLKELPQEVSHLVSLIRLDLSGCYQISALPESMRHMKQLKRLYLRQCFSLTEIPECFCSFLNLEELDLGWTAIEKLPHSIVSLENLQFLSVSYCRKLEGVPGIKQMKLLRGLELGGCRSLCDSFLERLQEANFQNLEKFSISGRRTIDGGSSYPQSLSFLLPKQFERGILYLHVDKSSLDNICSELGWDDERLKSEEDEFVEHDICLELDEWEDETLKSEEDRNMDSNDSELVYKSIPSDEVIDSQPGRVVLIEITTGDAKFQFSALIEIKRHEISEMREFRMLPTATFGRYSELMKMAKQAEFSGNGDSQRRTMMIMRVSIDGCVLLHGDLFTYRDAKDYVDLVYPDPNEADGNFVIVEFDWPY